jgi:hypothetical protein
MMQSLFDISPEDITKKSLALQHYYAGVDCYNHITAWTKSSNKTIAIRLSNNGNMFNSWMKTLAAKGYFPYLDKDILVVSRISLSQSELLPIITDLEFTRSQISLDIRTKTFSRDRRSKKIKDVCVSRLEAIEELEYTKIVIV